MLTITFKTFLLKSLSIAGVSLDSFTAALAGDMLELPDIVVEVPTEKSDWVTQAHVWF